MMSRNLCPYRPLVRQGDTANGAWKGAHLRKMRRCGQHPDHPARFPPPSKAPSAAAMPAGGTETNNVAIIRRPQRLHAAVSRGKGEHGPGVILILTSTQPVPPGSRIRPNTRGAEMRARQCPFRPRVPIGQWKRDHLGTVPPRDCPRHKDGEIDRKRLPTSEVGSQWCCCASQRRDTSPAAANGRLRSTATVQAAPSTPVLRRDGVLSPTLG